MAKGERKFGVMDDWAKEGPIDSKNYSQRAEAYCAVRSKDREGVHPTIRWGTPEFHEWWEYFERFLGRVPVALQRLMDNPNAGFEFTVPERLPKWFDSRFSPTPGWLPKKEPWEDLSSEERADVVRKLNKALGRAGFEMFRGADENKKAG